MKKIELFYSYSHEDFKYRGEIEKTLVLLNRKYSILEWSDRSIIPGQSISSSIQKKLNSSHIYLFLFSRDFIASEACNDEWRYVRDEIANNRHIYRIPIIVKDCEWQDFLDNDDVKALPDDGEPINNFQDENKAFKQIYNGIKQTIEDYQRSFTLKEDFLQEFEKTDFISQESINIKDIFIFPELTLYNNLNNVNSVHVDIKTKEDLLKNKFIIIKGDQNSGKTTLCKHLFLSYVKEELPVLFVDLENIKNKKAQENVFMKIYESQFNGLYEYWKLQQNKTIIFDNLSNAKNSLEHIQLAKAIFDKVIITASTDEYQAFFHDDERLIEFSEVKINELTHVKQENLIKNRLSIIDKSTITKEQTDQAEEKINSVMQNKLLPRYPFYILSILQTFEGFMPKNLDVSTYGHCYGILIISNLAKSGISMQDSTINACFRFLGNLAFEIYKSNNFSFTVFKTEHKSNYFIKDSLINRLSDSSYTLINKDGFKQDFIYYYFLGYYFAKNIKSEKEHIEEMVDKNYLKQNNLILLFIIHHTSDSSLIDDMLIASMCIFDNIPKATLNIKESSIISKLINTLPNSIMSNNSVDQERQIEREGRDKAESVQNEEDYDGSIEVMNDVYKIFKNNELFSQVLKNHHSDLEKERVSEIMHVIIDSGLRLVKLLLDEKEIEESINYIHKKKPTAKLEDVKNFCHTMCFFWTMENIERIVGSIKVKEIQDSVSDIVNQESTPAHDLIGYFVKLDSIDSFHELEKEHFNSLYKKYNNNQFMQRVISLRTQMYLNTHNVSASIEQSVYSILGLEYTPRLKKINH